MTFSELKADTRFLANSGLSYQNTDIERNLNRHYEDFVTLIERASGDWTFDDSNATDLPIGEATLEDGKQNFLLPTSARHIERIRVKNKAGSFVTLKAVANREIKYDNDAGMPTKYTLQGRSIVFDVPVSASSVTLDSGLEVMITRNVVKLENDTDVPGFDKGFHRYLSLGAAMDWCIAKTLTPTKRELEAEMNKLIDHAMRYFSQRNRDFENKIKVKRENYL